MMLHVYIYIYIYIYVMAPCSLEFDQKRIEEIRWIWGYSRKHL